MFMFSGNKPPYQVEPLNEVYFGKTDEMKAIVKQIGSIRKKYEKKYTAKFDTDPKMIKLNRMIEDQFGFGAFALSVIPSKYINAFTVAVDQNYNTTDLNYNMIANEKTFKYNKDANYSTMVFVYSGLFCNPAFTDNEIWAIILHEIGHNFYATLDGKLGVVSNLYNITNKMIGVAKAASKSDDAVEMEKNMAMEMRNPGWDIADVNVAETIKASNGVISPVDFFMKLANILTLGTFNLIRATCIWVNPINRIGKAARYRNERIADNFASMYGYGAELNSALYKMTDIASRNADKNKEKKLHIPILSDIYELNNTAAYVLLTSMDEHPGNKQRFEDQVALIERELNKEDIDPKMKKILNDDLKACKKTLADLDKQVAKIKDKTKARNIFMRALANISRRSEIKTCLRYDDPNKFENYDKIYDAKRVGDV